MRKFITRINGLFVDKKLWERQMQISDFAINDGWMDMGLYVYPNTDESKESRSARFDGIIAGVNDGDLAVFQLPTGNGFKWEQELIIRLKSYGVKVIILLHSLETVGIQNNAGMLQDVIYTCNQADALIVTSFDMMNIIKNYGISDNVSFVLHECWDNLEDNMLGKGGYYTRKALGIAAEAVVNSQPSLYSFMNRTAFRSHTVGRFTYIAVRESYSGKVAISYQYEGEADGITVMSDENILWQTDDMAWHYAVIDATENMEYHLEAYVYTSKGMLAVAKSESLTVSDPIFDINAPKISIVIPTYNSHNFIDRTIDNVLAQSQRDIELVVVDDESTDETVTMVEWYCQRFPNIRLYQKKNGGQSEARNLGIDLARGNYIGFMDHDDLLPVKAIEKLYNSITENNTDIALGAVEELSSTGRRILLRSSFKNNCRITPEEYLELCEGVVIWNKLYKASLCKKIKFGPRVFEDNAWTPVVISYADSLSCILETVYEFDQTRITENQRIRKRSPQELQQFLREAILFSLCNGNNEKLEVLRRNAIKSCNYWKNNLADHAVLLQEILDFTK